MSEWEGAFECVCVCERESVCEWEDALSVCVSEWEDVFECVCVCVSVFVFEGVCEGVYIYKHCTGISKF